MGFLVLSTSKLFGLDLFSWSSGKFICHWHSGKFCRRGFNRSKCDFRFVTKSFLVYGRFVCAVGVGVGHPGRGGERYGAHYSFGLMNSMFPCIVAHCPLVAAILRAQWRINGFCWHFHRMLGEWVRQKAASRHSNYKYCSWFIYGNWKSMPNWHSEILHKQCFTFASTLA